MTKRLMAALVSLLVVLGGAVASPQPASADTRPVGVHALKGMPRPGMHALTSCTVSTGCYSYVYGRQVVSAPSVSASAYMANPYLHDGHSLQEIAAESADSNQIVEVGWTKDPLVCGAGVTTTCLFTFAWVNNVAKCYNGCGYVALTGAPILAGAAFPAADMGTVKNFQIVHGGAPSGWYVYYNGAAFGYWPDTVWSAATPPVTFTTGGFFQIFGEVASVPTGNPNPSCSDMGTGIQGSLGQTNIPKPSSWSSTSFGGVANTSVNLTLGDTFATGYSHTFTGSATNVRSFSLGGPGGDSTGSGAVGITGGC